VVAARHRAPVTQARRLLSGTFRGTHAVNVEGDDPNHGGKFRKCKYWRAETSVEGPIDDEKKTIYKTPKGARPQPRPARNATRKLAGAPGSSQWRLERGVKRRSPYTKVSCGLVWATVFFFSTTSCARDLGHGDAEGSAANFPYRITEAVLRALARIRDRGSPGV